MKKKNLIIILVVVLIVMLIPIPLKLKDGGSTEYKSLLYNVTKIHRINHQSSTGYEDGWKIEILGFQIYNKTDVYVEVITIEELNNIQKQITDKLELQNNYNNFASCGVDTQRKVVVVELVDNSEEQQEWFKNNILDSKYIEFKQGGPYTTSDVSCLESLLGGYITSEIIIPKEVSIDSIIDVNVDNIEYSKVKVTNNGLIYVIVKTKDNNIISDLDNHFNQNYNGYLKTKVNNEYHVYIYNGVNDFNLDEILNSCINYNFPS